MEEEKILSRSQVTLVEKLSLTTDHIQLLERMKFRALVITNLMLEKMIAPGSQDSLSSHKYLRGALSMLPSSSTTSPPTSASIGREGCTTRRRQKRVVSATWTILFWRSLSFSSITPGMYYYVLVLVHTCMNVLGCILRSGSKLELCATILSHS